jgi:thymidylate kinase
MNLTPDFPKVFLIDGIDRLGKSSLIKRIQDELGYHLVIHYDKPKLLDIHLQQAKAVKEAGPCEDGYNQNHVELSDENLAKMIYQEDANRAMFKMIACANIPVIFDRTHLGEMVYAPLYRKYSGEYVYDYERWMLERKYDADKDVKLILLTTSNFDIVEDDGLGFDFSKKEDEQKMFIEAFNRSAIKNKVIVDVHNGNGGYKSFIEVFEEAILKK